MTSLYPPSPTSRVPPSVFRRLFSHSIPTRSPLLALLLLPACSDTDVCGARITLAADGTGSVVTSALRVPLGGPPLEAEGAGVEWANRAELQCSEGRFTDLGQLRIADIEFIRADAQGTRTLRVTFPRGSKARWLKLLAPTRDQRETVAKTFGPVTELQHPGSAVKFEIALPGPVVATGITPKGRGISVEGDADRAILVVPVDGAMQTDEPLVWHVTW